MAVVGRRPKGGYAAKLDAQALEGTRLGLYGPGWREQALSEETAQLHERAQGDLVGQKAIPLADPFAGTGFASLAQLTPGSIADSRGVESLLYDIQCYLARLGPDAPLKTLADFAKATASQSDIFGPDGRMAYAHGLPQFAACLADPSLPPDLSEFIAAKEAAAFAEVFDRHRLDALVFPQMRSEIAGLRDGTFIQETTVSEINIADLPGIVVPAGYFRSVAPFCLIIIGRQWSKGDLLAYTYAYEQATKHRRAPKLSAA